MFCVINYFVRIWITCITWLNTELNWTNELKPCLGTEFNFMQWWGKSKASLCFRLLSLWWTFWINTGHSLAVPLWAEPECTQACQWIPLIVVKKTDSRDVYWSGQWMWKINLPRLSGGQTASTFTFCSKHISVIIYSWRWSFYWMKTWAKSSFKLLFNI